VASYEDVLTGAGFTEDADMASKLQEWANHPETGEGSMSDNGAYEIQKAWTKGDATVVLEQNTAPDDLGDGMTAVVTHPPVLVVDSPKFRVSVRPSDTDALKDVLGHLA
jgi:hypothetical protein